MMRPEPNHEGQWCPKPIQGSEPQGRAPSYLALGHTEWTVEIPSVPGWYWLRRAVFNTALGKWHEPHAVVVELIPDATGHLLVYVTGTTCTRSIADLIVGEWNGPLALPE
jgi:hypothetical protein